MRIPHIDVAKSYLTLNLQKSEERQNVYRESVIGSRVCGAIKYIYIDIDIKYQIYISILIDYSVIF